MRHWSRYVGQDRRFNRPLQNAYLGPEYTDEEIQGAMRDADLVFQRFDAIEEEIAGLLSKNAVVARFAGRMEYGPRALGNRSILYPARDPATSTNGSTSN